ncbi:LytR/AlgR family response regulator transcription factor [Maribacter sp. 2307UL18-2]|uniref:LytR/AlgR family response regulator transcription factor n=1 Tax=Maribacter sp. 2307UL18-2 TaxID=3386274 RepID=UPI0039BCC3D0
MVLRAIIIDDEPLAINVLKNYIEKVGELQLEKTFSNAIEAQSYIQNNAVDIIFLDINMPLLSGLDFLKSMTIEPQVIITTAHEKYALQSYELEAIDYLIKPIPFPRFLKSVNRIIKLRNVGNDDLQSMPTRGHIFVKVDKKRLQKIYLDEIMVVESLKDYIRIITSASKYIVHRTLCSFTEELPSDKFMRIHRSFTVALDKVDVIEGNSLEIGGIRYTIGRSYLPETKDRLLNRIIKTS